MRRLVIPILMTALLVPALIFQARTIDPELCEAPEERLGELPGYVSEPVPVGEAEQYTLPKDTLFDKRLYTAADGHWFLVSLVIGGRSKSSIHRPEMCLPTQGFQMMDPRTRSVDGIDWRLVTLARKEALPLGFAYTFYNQEGFRTASHVRRIFQDVWDRSIRGRIDRWAMVTVNASTANDLRIMEFLRLLKGLQR